MYLGFGRKQILKDNNRRLSDKLQNEKAKKSEIASNKRKEKISLALSLFFSPLEMFREETLDIIIISEGEINPPGENNRKQNKEK